MNKALLSFAILLSLIMAACSDSGFFATSKDSVHIAVGKTNSETQTAGPTPFVKVKDGLSGAGSITVGGALLTDNNGKSQLNPKLHIGQSALRAISPDLRHLDRIEKNSTYVQLGCESGLPDAGDKARGLTEAKAQREGSIETAVIKAKTVFICGQNILRESFITIVADELVLVNSSLLVSSSTGAGFLAAYVNKISMTGENQIISRASNPGSLGLRAPSITLFVQQAVDGNGSLEIRTIGAPTAAVVGQ